MRGSPTPSVSALHVDLDLGDPAEADAATLRPPPAPARARGPALLEAGWGWWGLRASLESLLSCESLEGGGRVGEDRPVPPVRRRRRRRRGFARARRRLRGVSEGRTPLGAVHVVEVESRAVARGDAPSCLEECCRPPTYRGVAARGGRGRQLETPRGGNAEGGGSS
jgi:hypothetical protein